mmetsp:Transcript_29936/g.41448  ORF Transcript_29936/g.41448 Transcript_29936/m.41448 type:complete len:233 (+) Transcript_29936:358-1056(+)
MHTWWFPTVLESNEGSPLPSNVCMVPCGSFGSSMIISLPYKVSTSTGPPSSHSAELICNIDLTSKPVRWKTREGNTLTRTSLPLLASNGMRCPVLAPAGISTRAVPNSSYCPFPLQVPHETASLNPRPSQDVQTVPVLLTRVPSQSPHGGQIAPIPRHCLQRCQVPTCARRVQPVADSFKEILIRTSSSLAPPIPFRESYCALFTGSLRTSFASVTSLNFSAACGLSLFLSG